MNTSDRFDPTNPADQAELSRNINQLVAVLSEEQQRVMRFRLGLDRGDPRTVAETAIELGITEDQVREIEQGALAKLRSSEGESS